MSSTLSTVPAPPAERLRLCHAYSFSEINELKPPISNILFDYFFGWSPHTLSMHVLRQLPQYLGLVILVVQFPPHRCLIPAASQTGRERDHQPRLIQATGRNGHSLLGAAERHHERRSEKNRWSWSSNLSSMSLWKLPFHHLHCKLH